MGAYAQGLFIDKLVSTPTSGQGVVRVYQSAEIARLVNGKGKQTSVPAKGQGELGQAIETGAADAIKTSTRKLKTNGYRIQIYAGGNSRVAKQEAQRIAGKFRTYFSDLSVYTHFQSPRWICRVGDFRTYEEASEVLRELRATNQFNEALIVKSVIQIPY